MIVKPSTAVIRLADVANAAARLTSRRCGALYGQDRQPSGLIRRAIARSLQMKREAQMTRRSQSLAGRTVSPRALYLAALLVFGLLAFSQSPLGPSPVSAQTITVNTSSDTGDGFCSLREAIINANNDDDGQDDCPAGTGVDTIVFAAGVNLITLSSALPSVTDNQLLTIDGGDDVTIDGDDLYRPFDVDPGASLTLRRITVTNGMSASRGGAIHSEGTLLVIDSVISESTATDRAGGIYNDGGTLTVTDSTVSGNSAGQRAGGIYNDGGTLTVSDSTLSDNSADQRGGGIYNEDGDATLTECTVSGNSAVQRGGGLYIESGSVSMRDCTVGDDNTSDGDGGGIYNESNNVTIHESTISDNTADQHGGGIYNDQGNMFLTETVLSNNEASSGNGGGIYNDMGHVELMESVVGGESPADGNSAGDDGGGIYTQQPLIGNASLLLTESSVSNNTADGSGGGVFNFNDHVELTRSFVLDNTAAGNGGGIYTFGEDENPETLLISDSTISGNEATEGSGGGIYNFRDHVELFETTVSHNTAGDDGGGIFTQGIGVDQTLLIDRSTISDNEAVSGGGLFNFGDVVTISNSTISGNDATGGGGGGIANGARVGSIDLLNVTIAFNESLQVNSGIFNDGLTTAVTLINTIVAENIAADCSGNGVTSNGHNLDSDGTCLLTTANGDIPNGFANLGPLTGNGGPTETHELLPGSEAIDAGDNPTCQVPPVDGEDQRGVERPFDGDDDGTAVCDIGAFEVSDEEDDDDDPPNTPTPTPTRTATRTPVPTATSGASSLGGPIGGLFDAAGAARASRATPVPATAPASAPAQQPPAATGGIRPPSTGDGGLER